MINILLTILIVLVLLIVLIAISFGKTILRMGDKLNSDMAYDVDMLLIIESGDYDDEKGESIKKVLMSKYGEGILEEAVKRIRECTSC
jgi:hypothetical protein